MREESRRRGRGCGRGDRPGAGNGDGPARGAGRRRRGAGDPTVRAPVGASELPLKEQAGDPTARGARRTACGGGGALASAATRLTSGRGAEVPAAGVGPGAGQRSNGTSIRN